MCPDNPLAPARTRVDHSSRDEARYSITGAVVSGIDVRELEMLLVLAEELHFGRAGERLYISQSRVSQLLRALEARIGGQLFERSSRSVALTPLGERFVADVRPAYEALRAGVERARDAAHGCATVLRLGFQGAVDGSLATALRRFERVCPDQSVELIELPLSEPFAALRRRAVDAAIVLLPVREDDLELGPSFSREPQTLAVPAHHPFATRATVDAEDLAACALVDLAGAAPRYWRRAQTPPRTPAGRPIPTGPSVTTLQEGLSLVAAGRGAMLLCRATAKQHAGRRSLAFVPVAGLPPSTLGLVWRRGLPPPAIHALGRAIVETDR